jgi:hypothetical protein
MQDHHPTGERRRRGKGGTRARVSQVWFTHAHTFIRSHSVPFLLLLLRAKLPLRKAFQEESKVVVWKTGAQRLRPKPPGLVRGRAGAGTLWGQGGRATMLPTCFSLAAATPGAFTAQMANPPSPWLAACHVSFCWVWNGPLMSGSGVSQRPLFSFLVPGVWVFLGLVWWKRKRHAAFRRQGGDLPFFSYVLYELTKSSRDHVRWRRQKVM